MPPRTPTMVELEQVLDKVDRHKAEIARKKEKKAFFLKALAQIEKTQEKSDFARACRSTRESKQDGPRVILTSPWHRSPEKEKHEGKDYFIDFRCKQEHSVAAESQEDITGLIDRKEIAKQPITLEMCVTHEETGVAKVYPVALFTPPAEESDGTDYAVHWARLHSVTGSTEWEELYNIGSSVNYEPTKIECIRDSLALLD